MEKNKFKPLHIFMPRVRIYIAFIIIFNIVIVTIKPNMLPYCLIVLIAILYYSYVATKIRKKEISRCIEDLTFNMDVVTKDTLLNFMLPLIVVDIEGNAVWQNKRFNNTFDNNSSEEITSKILKNINMESLVESKGNISDYISINDKTYNVRGNVIRVEESNTKSDILMMLYFIDNTEYTMLLNKNEKEQLCIGMVVIDNYDDIMQIVDERERAYITTEIEKEINEWMKNIGGLVNKLDRDRYVIIFENQYLDNFYENKFEILDIIKKITTNNKFPITISLGIATDGETILDKFKNAITSIDLALGRGGDQVVIKNDGDYKFYGGKTRELEKRSRVRSRVMAYALRELIEKSDNVFIIGHKSTDVDCIGSAMGLYRMAKTLDKEAYIISDNQNISTQIFIDRINKLKKYENVLINIPEFKKLKKAQSLLIIVDTHRPSYLSYPEVYNEIKNKILIDHHRRGSEFIQDTILSFHEIYASSTSELVTEILMYNDDVALEATEAEALYAGILIDTKDFSFKTGVRTFEAAAYLKKVGVDISEVKQIFQTDFDTYTQISEVVKNAEFVSKDIAIAVCPESINNKSYIAAKAADELLTISEVIASFVLVQIDNTILISGRSTGDINVQVILEKLGGGGHITFAGAQLQNISMEEAKIKIIESIREYKDSIPNESN